MNCLPQRMKPNNLFALWDCKCKRYMHAPNDCILYRDEYENLDAYPVCSALRYKIRKDDPGDVGGGASPEESSCEGHVVFAYNTTFEASI